MATSAKTGVTSYATPTDKEVIITRVVDAPRRLVFDAWTNPKHIPQWMGFPEGWTMPLCEIDLRPGGAWHYVWRRNDGGGEMSMSGTVREVSDVGSNEVCPTGSPEASIPIRHKDLLDPTDPARHWRRNCACSP